MNAASALSTIGLNNWSNLHTRLESFGSHMEFLKAMGAHHQLSN